MEATILVATDRNWLIGNRPDPNLPGKTPWQGLLPADMEYFMDQTVGKVTYWTRPTYLTIPRKFRPLRERKAVVLTRHQGFAEEGCTVVHHYDDAFKRFPDDEIVICGGGQLYQLALNDPRVGKVLRTLVEAEFEGNVHFPNLDRTEWDLLRRIPHACDERNKFDYVFETYVRL